MKPFHKITAVVFAGSILFLAAAWWVDFQSKDDAPFIKLGNLSFHTSIEPGIKEAKSLNKPVFLYFRSETCYWCIRFEEEALSDSMIVSLLEKNFVLISIDTFKQQKVASALNVRSTPYMIFFDKDGEKEISRIPGYVPKEEFLDKLYELLRKREMGS
ncbi:Thiol:disulfide interchange protein DsbD [uncultured archaeon]|nr:Thiol:disulfide interchange protein DsbD [uncultured archaeon]